MFHIHTSAPPDCSLHVHIFRYMTVRLNPCVRAQLVQVDSLLLTRSQRHNLRTTNYILWQQNNGARVRTSVHLGAVSAHNCTGLLDIQLVTARTHTHTHTHTQSWSRYTRRQPNINSVFTLKVFECSAHEICGRDSSVSIATCYGLDGPGIESR